MLFMLFRCFPLFVLLLVIGACSKNNNTENKTEVLDTLETQEPQLTEKIDSVASIEIVEEVDSLNIEAEFLYFSLGDASHYIFRDSEGKVWDFADISSNEFSFERGLEEEDMNEENQGWGSNEEYQRKWFKIRIKYEERQMYIDGPVGQVALIEHIEAIAPRKSVYADGGMALTIEDYNGNGEFFLHKNDVSPDGTVKLEAEELDPSAFAIRVRFDSVHHVFNRVYGVPNEFYWSKNSKYVLIHNIDYYSNGGTQSLFIVNPKTGANFRLGSSTIMEQIKRGKRDMLILKSIDWIDNVSFTLSGHIQYLGESGHPGIDSNRKSELGKNFGNTADIVPLPKRVYKIIKDEYTELLTTNEPEPLNIPLKDYVSNGEEVLQTVHHYICYSGSERDGSNRIWVSFEENSKAIKIKYEGQDQPYKLVFTKEETFQNGTTIVKHYQEVIDGKITGNYKLTHAGIWDYVTFTRARDLEEFNYTIIHDADPYGKHPCFE